MTEPRHLKGRRGAAIIYVMGFMAIILLTFTLTFSAFKATRQVNQAALNDLQKQANALRVHRPEARP